MIFHAALPADDTQFTAKTLARMLGGEAMPFPPAPDSWMAWSQDGKTELEIIPRGMRFEYGANDVHMEIRTGGPREAEWHIAIGTPLPAADVLAIAEEAGWPARVCERHPEFFSVIEVYIDGATFLEILDPAMQARYVETMNTRNWKRVFGMAEAA